jgi:ferredoxin
MDWKAVAGFPHPGNRQKDAKAMHDSLHTLHFSPTGGTAKLVRAVAEGFGLDPVVHDLTLPGGRDGDLGFTEQDVVIIGVPVYAGRVPLLVASHFDRVRGNGAMAILVGVYGNRAFEDALLELKDLCRGRGFRCLAAGAFIAEHSTAPAVATARPDPADLKAARTFGAEAAAKRRRLTDSGGLPDLVVPGTFPYRDRPPRVPMAPDTNDDCVGCRTCADHCPTGAISAADPRRADPGRCIRCSSCVQRCRLKAKSFSHPDYLKRRALLTAQFVHPRREPECFL